MEIKLSPHYIEFKHLTESQLDYLHNFGSFRKLYEANGVYRLYGEPDNLYTALLLIAKKYSIEIISQ